MIKPGWIPALSPHSLIQEALFPDEWKMLVACILLNQTSRKQVEKIIVRFFEKWPTPQHLIVDNSEAVVDVIRILGLSKRRVENLTNMSKDFLGSTWVNARNLRGIGEYGGRCHDILCRDILGDVEPKDGALALYWRWRVQQTK